MEKALEIQVIAQALGTLARSAQGLEVALEHYPDIKIRFRSFRITQNVVWPSNKGPDYIEDGGTALYLYGSDVYRREIAERIYRQARHRPREVLRAVRRLQAAAEWCDARVAGLQRAWAELRRQQARAVEALEAEAALTSLVDVVGPRSP